MILFGAIWTIRAATPKAFLKLLYRGRRDQTYADLNKVLRIEITEDSPTQVQQGRQGRQWDFQNLSRVTEATAFFELCRGRRSAVRRAAQDALREGTVGVPQLRWSKGDKTVEYWIPGAAKRSGS